MPEIVLTTLNARWAHCALGLRYLLANLGELRAQAVIREFDMNRPVAEVAGAILADRPRIVGIGVYVWNATASLHLVRELKRLAPEVVLVLGGPEVSYEYERQEIVARADYLITGEADLAFAELCGKLQRGEKPMLKVIAADPPAWAEVELPYDLYDDRDLAQRTVYVEASRGCPFSCEFCLSSLDIPVRALEPERFLPAMQRLWDRGLRRFKFVDRTFNVNIRIARAILEFFLERYESGMFLHFEMIPDRLPAELREIIARFPAGALQFEVGVQTFNEEVAQRISRRQDAARVAENLRWLRAHTGVYVHADLIAGLPGETLASFGAGFDRLWRLQPDEIQIELLKRLRGTPIARHDRAWGMVYAEAPPYELRQTSVLSAKEVEQVRRLARYWDLVGNSGNFASVLERLLGDQPFAAMMELSAALYRRFQRTHGIALTELMSAVLDWMVATGRGGVRELAERMWADYRSVGRSDVPVFLRPHVDLSGVQRLGSSSYATPAQPRQARRRRPG